MQNPSKRLFLVATGDSLLAEKIQTQINKNLSEATVYIAIDHKEAYFKGDNALPHVAIVDANLPKVGGFEVVKNWLDEEKHHKLSVILITEIPDKEHFVDQVVAGIVQFLTVADIDTKLSGAITKALNRVKTEDSQPYKMRLVAAKEFLFHQGDVATSVFLVKKGELAAIKKDGNAAAVLLGKISPGEFVGEMAHINNDNRSASVQAITDCELIEISRDHLDSILMSKPAWAKALIATLSKRLKAQVSKS